ncbi:Coatomer_beta' subunit [Hexamita inflata]|uniref:Beta'-coat protein n=1 Tax=Hexamita inflata TaxID=28002 RepID=A0AA86Q9S9_9EUKA|nr:Coatomer beta' subunit [Hexamita inflata]
MSSLPAISTLAQIRSARVKCTDFHPTRQQVIIGLYSGEIILYDYKANQQVKQVALLSSPIRSIKYIADGIYFAVGSDDGRLRIYDSFSFQLRQNIKAHVDFVRSIVLHPSAPVILTAGDDTIIRAWSYNKSTAALELEAEYTGHEHFVMSISSDPQGLRLVSASQDKTVKIWDISHFQNIEDFRTKAQEGRIGNQMGKREESLVDKMNMKTVNSLTKQAGNMITGFVTNTPAFKSNLGEDFTPRVKFDPLFTLNGHADCVNQAVWCESQALSGGQENPYAQGCLQFIASVSDDHDLFIWDTYSRQIIKKQQQHTDVINSVHFVKQLQLLVTSSEDNSTILISTQSMAQERTLNFGLERGWCCSSIQSGASTILALGYDAGTVILRIGDFAPVCAFSSQKATRFVVSGQYNHAYSKIDQSLTVGGFIPKSSSNLALSNNLAKALISEPEFKQITDDVPGVIKKMEYSAGGKFLCIQGESEAVILSALTGKKKFDCQCRQFCFAAEFVPSQFTLADKPEKFEYDYESTLEQQNVYAIVTEKQRRVIKIFSASDSQELQKVKVDFPVDKLFSGPLMGVANNEVFVLYDWEEGKFVTQIDMQVTQVIWNSAGDLVTLVTPTETYILQVNYGQIASSLSDEAYDEYNGVDNAVTELICLPVTIQSGAFTSDSKLFVYADLEGVHQLFMDEVTQQDSTSSVLLQVDQLKQVIQVLGTYNIDSQTERIVLFGEANASYYNEQNLLYVAAVNVDKSVLTFKQLALNGKINEAVEYAKENLKSKSAIEFAADYLIKVGAATNIVVDLLPDVSQKIKYAHKLKRYDLVVELNGEDLRLTAEDAFMGGYITEACNCYIKLQDWSMVLICAYILGDLDALKLLIEKAENNVKFRAAILLDDVEAALNALDSPAQQVIFKKARDMLSPDDIAKWKLQLIEAKRSDVADSLEEQ